MSRSWLWGSGEFPAVPQALASTDTGALTPYPLVWTRDEMIENEWRWKKMTLAAAGTLVIVVPTFSIATTESWSISKEVTPIPGSKWDVVEPDDVYSVGQTEWGQRVFEAAESWNWASEDNVLHFSVQASFNLRGLYRRDDGLFTKNLNARCVASGGIFSSSDISDALSSVPIGASTTTDGFFTVVDQPVAYTRYYALGSPFPGELAGASLTLSVTSFTVALAQTYATPDPIG